MEETQLPGEEAAAARTTPAANRTAATTTTSNADGGIAAADGDAAGESKWYDNGAMEDLGKKFGDVPPQPKFPQDVPIRPCAC